jgi:hypothetical protein
MSPFIVVNIVPDLHLCGLKISSLFAVFVVSDDDEEEEEEEDFVISDFRRWRLDVLLFA